MDIKHVLRVLDGEQLIPAEPSAAYVVGSRARGWSNNKSDWDIYVITGEEWFSETGAVMPMALNPPRVVSESFYHGETRWEVTYWLASQVHQMLRKVSWEEFRRGLPAGQVLTPREELFLGRLLDAAPLTGHEWLQEAREELERSAFRAFLLSRSLGLADDAVEDVLGQMESGELQSAVLSARAALKHAVDALLESHGEYGSLIPKWRPQRFQAAKPSVISFEDYWSLETMRTYDPADPTRWIEEVLALCQEISMGVEVS